MKKFIQRQRKIKLQFLLGLFCIAILSNPQSISANSILSRSSTIASHSEVEGVSNHESVEPGIITPDDESENQVPETSRLESRHGDVQTGQNLPTASLTNVSPIRRIKSIMKRSAHLSSFPNEFPTLFHFDNTRDSRMPVYDCKDYAGLCNEQFFNNQPQENEDHDYSPLSDEEFDHYRTLGSRQLDRNVLPYGKVLQSSSVDKSYIYPAQDEMIKVPDAYTDTRQFPKIVILALQKQDDLNRQSLSTKQNKLGDSVEEEFQPIKEAKKNVFTSRGWGAGGMPFSVLYMRKNQHAKPASRSVIAGAQQLVAPAPLRGYPTAGQYQQVAVRNALSSALTAGNTRAGGPGTPLPTRRQYSIIPQLYVSYGWGPRGK